MEWDQWWNGLDPATRKTIAIAQRKGRPLKAAEHEPPTLFVEGRRLYRAYTEINRDGFSGALLFESMCAVLDEYGVTDREERARARDLWREMATKERELRDAKAPLRT